MSTKISYRRIKTRIHIDIIMFSNFTMYIYIVQICYARETNLLPQLTQIFLVVPNILNNRI